MIFCVMIFMRMRVRLVVMIMSVRMIVVNPILAGMGIGTTFGIERRFNLDEPKAKAA